MGGSAGVDDNQSGIDGVIQSGMAEQPASAMPMKETAATTSPTRDMTLSVPNVRTVSPLTVPVKPASHENMRCLHEAGGRSTLGRAAPGAAIGL
jgi:hypothetical protein